LPYVGGAIIGLMLLFSLYVHSLPAVEPPTKKAPSVTNNVSPDGIKVPEGVKVQTQKIVKENELPEQLEEDLNHDDDVIDGEM
jgi:hypothetical protein